MGVGGLGGWDGLQRVEVGRMHRGGRAYRCNSARSWMAGVSSGGGEEEEEDEKTVIGES